MSYGKLVALLAVRTRDLAGAEDALSSALVRALEQWPAGGVPENPDAWLLSTARRIAVDHWRRLETAQALSGHVELLARERVAETEPSFADERLKLLLVCAHPSIDVRARTPLMLQTVLGLDARRIGSAFLVAPATMGQRLSRAKAKIRDGGIRFEVPALDALPRRIDSVLDAIYAAYTLGWDNAFSDDGKTNALSDEAIWLARLIVELLPGDAEAKGLLALMLFSESRRPARRDPISGDYVDLARQDTGLWSEPLIAEAEQVVRSAGSAGELGRYQIEAAIQAVHAARRLSGSTDWAAIAHLYLGLTIHLRTIGARVAYAAVLSEAENTGAALRSLAEISEESVSHYQPYWAVRAHLLALANERAAAVSAFERAIGLTEDVAVRCYLAKKKQALLEDR